MCKSRKTIAMDRSECAGHSSLFRTSEAQVAGCAVCERSPVTTVDWRIIRHKKFFLLFVCWNLNPVLSVKRQSSSQDKETTLNFQSFYEQRLLRF